MTGIARTAESTSVTAIPEWASVQDRLETAAGAWPHQADAEATPWHQHDQHQLEYAFEGTVGVETRTARYRLPSLQAVWIPAGLLHRSSFRKARTVSVFFDAALVREVGDRVRVLSVGPLLREMLVYSARWPINRPASDAVADTYFEALAHLVLEGLEDEKPFHLPTSTDPLITAIMRCTDDHLASVTLEEVCRVAAVSERTLRRRFHAATGLTWRQYLQRARLLQAVNLLASPRATVLGVATAVGFDSASAFSRAFQEFTGQSPTAFRRERLAAASEASGNQAPAKMHT